MASKYKSKQPKQQTKQMPYLKELSLLVAKPKPRCTNCGAVSYHSNYSKCFCGGTYQLWGSQ